MSSRKRKKASEMLLENLKERSKKGLEFARRTILMEKIECERIREALEYYTSNWEIFTHPGLVSIACEAVGGNPDKAVEIQAVIAMIVAALDVHDDIIDKSDTKHGRPTVFGKFGQDMALLLGNAFLVSGFTLLDRSTAKFPREKRAEIFQTLKKSLFELGVAHALELNLKERIDVVAEEYMQILNMKATSVEADMRIGAIIGGGTNSEVQVLTRYGRILGILATLREEFIDIFEIEELSQRIQNEYVPIPVLFAMQDKNSEKRIRQLLTRKHVTNKDVDDLLDIVFEAKSVRKLRKMMNHLIEESTRLTPIIKNGKIRTTLEKLAVSALEDLQ
jgi:geranylgeranyl pyrophosphate synthase